jgi:hypothetical protein
LSYDKFLAFRILTRATHIATPSLQYAKHGLENETMLQQIRNFKAVKTITRV